MSLSKDNPYVRRVRPDSTAELVIELTTGEVMRVESDDWIIDREHHRIYINLETIIESLPPVAVHVPLGTLDGDSESGKVESKANARLPIIRYAKVLEISEDPKVGHEFEEPIVELWLGQDEESNPIWTKGATERLLP